MSASRTTGLYIATCANRYAHRLTRGPLPVALTPLATAASQTFSKKEIEDECERVEAMDEKDRKAFEEDHTRSHFGQDYACPHARTLTAARHLQA